MIEVFRTNVYEAKDAEQVIGFLENASPGCMASFDLEDCDKVLRMENPVAPFQPQAVIALLNKYGFQCEILPG